MNIEYTTALKILSKINFLIAYNGKFENLYLTKILL